MNINVTTTAVMTVILNIRIVPSITIQHVSEIMLKSKP